MSIDCLLKLFNPYLNKVHISQFQGTTAAVDALNWLYRALYLDALPLLKGQESQRYLQHFFSFIAMLQLYSIKPVLVFDGRSLSSKKQTVDMRVSERLKNQEKAKQALAKGEEETARIYAQRAIRIQEKHIDKLFSSLRENKIQFIVAPYQSDGQLAHLVLSGKAHFAISEDSDLICYQIPRILFKLDNLGLAKYFDLHSLQSAQTDWSVRAYLSLPDRQRKVACIIAGCDYLSSLRGIGIKTALKKFEKNPCYNQILSDLSMRKDAPPDYREKVLQTLSIFQHHIIWDSGKATYLTQPQPGTDLKLLGDLTYCSNQIALGFIHPYNLQPRPTPRPYRMQVSQKRMREVRAGERQQPSKPQAEQPKCQETKAESTKRVQEKRDAGQLIDSLYEYFKGLEEEFVNFTRELPKI